MEIPERLGVLAGIPSVVGVWIFSGTTQCVVPENIHTPPTEGIGNSGEEGGSRRAKNLKQCMKLNWNFRRSGGGS